MTKTPVEPEKTEAEVDAKNSEVEAAFLAKLSPEGRAKFEAIQEPIRRAGDEAIAWLAQERAGRSMLPSYTVRGDGVGRNYQPGPNASVAFKARLCRAFGTTSEDFAEYVIHQLVAAPDTMSPQLVARRVNAGIAFIAGEHPTGETETLALLGAWLSQDLANREAQCARAADTVTLLEAHGTIAAKMGNVAVRHLEALAKLRAGGQQRVEVTHVHVNGNAVIGDLRTDGGEGEPTNCKTIPSTSPCPCT